LNKSLELYNEALIISKKNLTKYFASDSLSKNKLKMQSLTHRYLFLYETSLRYKGIVNYFLGKYPEALENYHASLKISEDLNEQNDISKCLSNIGMILYNQGDYENAIVYISKSLENNKKLNDTEGVLTCLNLIGNIYNKQNDNAKALDYYKNSLKINEDINNENGMSINYANIGTVYKKLKDYKQALEYYQKSVDIDIKINDLSSVSVNYNNMSILYEEIGDYQKSLQFAFKSVELSKKIGVRENLKHAYGIISESSAKLGNFKQAYEYYNLYSTIKDSIYNEQSNRTIREMDTKYQTEKKQQEIVMLNKDKELQKTEIAWQEAEVKQQTTQKYAFIAGFILTLILSLVAYNSLKLKKKANKLLAFKNEEITQQKEEISAQRDEIESQRDLVTIQKENIEEIHKEVTDSINYAKNIQSAILPDNDLIQMLLNEYFILFKPKNIVSGDFYWITIRKGWILVAVADCTGHGVPGAFMSMLGISFLNEIVAREDVQTAGHVLDLLRKNVIKSMKQKGITGEQKDGMDIAFVALNIETLELQFAGANNPLYIVQKESAKVSSGESEINNLLTFSPSQSPTFTSFTENSLLIELKPDKMPIAIHIRMDDFTNHKIQLCSGDTIYLFSDGYADQFGGFKGKKFLYKQFKELLNFICNKLMTEQKEILENKIEDWINGNEIKYEQTDDITVVGIKI